MTDTPTRTRTPSLQGRILRLALGLLLLAWLMAGLVTWFGTRHELDEMLDGHLAQAAALLVVQQANAYTSDGDEDDHGDGPREVPVLHRYAPRVAFQVWHEGILTTRSPNAPAVPMGPNGQHAPEGFATLRLDDGDWRVFTTRGLERDVRVYVAEQMDSRLDILTALLEGLLWPAAVTLPLLALGLWWAVRRSTGPMRALGHTLAARSADALAPVAAPDAPAEMRPMVDALNGLLARIAELVDTERRFTADAAHELRTPIAAIRAQAQVALRLTDNAAERQHALRATLAGCDRATRVVEQLLTLARLEGGAQSPRQPVAVAAVARQVLADLAPRAVERQQNLALELLPADEAWTVAGDATLLSLLLRNLVDNALRYSPGGAEVQLRIEAGPEGHALWVEDSGPGLAEADLARLGERFFRVLGTEASGSGLGWSIVRRVAQAQGIALTLGRSERLGGLAVALRWTPAGLSGPRC